MCGIWGFNGKKDRKVDPKKLLILGLYNRTRGTDSCGYYYNGNIVKGTGAESDFKDFIVKNRFFPGDLPFETVMCHARKSTYGAHSDENAHPHQINNLVQTHNGTIKNIWELCRRHEIDFTTINVDSIGLAHIIQKDGFKVLNDYEGYAALTMVFTDDPATLYLYHGASRETTNGTIFEERPLFYLLAAEGIYYSSMEEALKMINVSKNKPEILPHNCVYKVQNGEIQKNIFTVDGRDNANVSKAVIYSGNARYASQANNAYSNNITTFANRNANHKTKLNELPFYQKTANKANERCVILTESDPPERNTQDVYFKYGRFHKSDYRWVADDDGKYDHFESLDVLMQGVYTINRLGEIVENPKDSTSKTEEYYFVRGAMMKDKKNYDKCLLEITPETDIRYNICITISKFSRHPITSYFDEGSACAPSVRNTWYYDAKPFDGDVDIKFGKRKYIIKKGQFDCIRRPSESLDKQVFDKPEELPVNRQIYIDGVEFVRHVPSDKPSFEKIFSTIETWCDRIIRYDEVEHMPESFILFVEAYAEECSSILLSERELFNATFKLFTYLINKKETFYEYLKSLFEPTGYVTLDLVKKYLGQYTPEEIVEMPNRYTFQAFMLLDDVYETEDVEAEIIPSTTDVCKLPDPKPDETAKQNDMIPEIDTMPEQEHNNEELELIRTERLLTKTRTEAIKKQLKILSDAADELQALNTNDPAQNIAFKVYDHIQKVEKEIEKELEKIK